MEIEERALEFLAKATPGNFAIYSLVDGKLKVLYRSAGLPALSGMDDEEYDALTKEDSGNIVFPSDRERILSLLLEFLRNHADLDFTYRICHKSQGAIWIHARSRYLGEKAGAPVLLTTFSETSSESEAIAVLLNHGLNEVYVVDAESKEILYANERARDSWRSPDCDGKRCHEVLCSLKEPCPWCPIGKMKEGSFHSDSYYSPILGRYYDLLCREMDWHGRKAIAFYAHDITNEKKSVAKAEFDKKSLELIVNNLPVGVAAVEIDNGKVTATVVNAKLSELLGMTAEDFVSPGPSSAARVVPADRPFVYRALTGIRDDKAPVSFEFRLLSLEGEEHWIHSEATSLQEGGKKIVFLAVSDVTAEKRAEREALRSQEIYQAAVEAAHLSAWEYDLTSHKITLAKNPSTGKNIAGIGIPIDADDILKEAEKRMEPSSITRFHALYAALARGEKKVTCEIAYKPTAGHGKTYERIVYTMLFDAEGKPAKAIGIAQNITAEKRDEEKYRKAFHVLDDVHSFSLGSFRLNVSKNSCFAAQSPYPQIRALAEKGTIDDFVKDLTQTIPDPSTSARIRRDFSSKGLLNAFALGKTRVSSEFPSRFHDGTLHWCEGFVFLFANPKSGEVEGLAYSTLIDERKKTENVISHLTSKKFDYIGIIHLREKTIEFVNKIPFIAFGSSAPSPYEDWRRYIKGNFVVPEDLDSYNAGTDLSLIEKELFEHGDYAFTWHQHYEGGLSHKQNVYSWLDEKAGDVLVLRSDVTRTYEAEQNQLLLLQNALKSAEEANESKSEFLSRISHDIRTPISIIKSMTSFALQDMEDETKLREDLKAIDSSNTFLLSLINDVLDISKIESGKIELHPEPYVFKDYLANIVQMGQSLCANKGLHFSVEKSGSVGTIRIDHIRLNQITLNLLSNAVKYTPIGGSVTFRASSVPSASKQGYLHCRVEIQDTGIGMSEDFQKRMFEPFTQEYDNPNRPKANTGTGLGLTIVKRLVDLLGGTIEVKSHLNEGTSIAVIFEAPEAAESADPDSLPEKAKPLPPLEGRVLLCEDNVMNQAIAKRILTSFGLQVDVAANGLEAVEAFKTSEKDAYLAILMDLQMPLMNGYEASAKIRSFRRADAKKIPIIAMTADAFTAAFAKSKAAGMNDYLTKPLDPVKIRAVLSSIKK